MKKFFFTILLSISLCFSKIAFGVDALTLNDLSPTNTVYTSQQVDQIADDISHEMTLDYATQIWVNNHQWDWTTQVTNKPSIPTVGTLNTTATSAQSTSTSESLSGNITLHKIAKTGVYGDLSGKPMIPTVGTLNTTLTTAQTTSANESLSGTIKLHKVAKTGTFSDMIGNSLMLGFEDKYVKIDNVGNIKYYNVFEGNDEYTLNLPRKNGYLAVLSDIPSTNGLASISYVNTASNNIVNLIPDVSGYVPWANSAKNAVTIGSRSVNYTQIGKNTLAVGANVAVGRDNSYNNSVGIGGNVYVANSSVTDSSCFASGSYVAAQGRNSIVLGSIASNMRGKLFNSTSGTPDNYSFTWSGKMNNGNTPKSSEYYYSHGEGTFNINPKPVSPSTDPASGFYIGESNLIQIVNALVDKRIAYAVENGITVNGTNYVLITENTLTNVLQNYHGQRF